MTDEQYNKLKFSMGHITLKDYYGNEQDCYVENWDKMIERHEEELTYTEWLKNMLGEK